jgi:DNA-binding HxlR family transcriptional regulator
MAVWNRYQMSQSGSAVKKEPRGALVTSGTPRSGSALPVSPGKPHFGAGAKLSAKRRATPAPNPYQADCPTRMVLDRIGDKWAVLALGLLRNGPVRFNRLRRSIEGVSQKMLSQTLKSLERDGLVHRRAFATVPVTVEYSLTPLGRTLSSTLDALRDWAERHIEEVRAAQRRYDRASTG